MNSTVHYRKQLIERVRRRLERKSSPRFQMTLMVLATACAGFLCSFVLLQFGWRRMWLRYSVSVAAAYGVFIGLIYLWIQATRLRVRPITDPNPLDLLDPLTRASASSFSHEPAPSTGPTSQPSGILDFDLSLDGDGLVVVIVMLLTVGVAVIASIYVITQAPTLLAEVFVDGALSVGLYRRLRSIEHRHWLDSAMSRTWIPFFWVLVFFVIAGVVMHSYAPEAVSIGGVWQHLIRKP